MEVSGFRVFLNVVRVAPKTNPTSEEPIKINVLIVW